MTTSTQTRIDVLAIAVQEIARALAPAQSAAVADALSARVATMFDRPVAAAADEAITAELVALLSALGRQAAVMR